MKKKNYKNYIIMFAGIGFIFIIHFLHLSLNYYFCLKNTINFCNNNFYLENLKMKANILLITLKFTSI